MEKMLNPQFKNLDGQEKLFATYDKALAEIWPVPFEEKNIHTEYGTVHLVVSGNENAPPLFLLHGRSSNSLYWYQTIKNLSADFKIYCMDVLGDWGKSVPVKPPETREQFAQCLEQVFSAVNVKKSSIAGLSYGGFLSMNLAIQKPDLVEKLILLAPAATILPLSQKFWRTTLISLAFPTKRVIKKNISTFTYKRTFRSRYLDEMRYYGFRYGKISTMKVRPIVFTEQELGSLSMPVLFLVGEQEMIYDPSKALKRAMELIPGCKGEMLPECGHAIYTDQPELLVEKMKEFLLSHSYEVTYA